ncbi:MAG: tryptophan synthase subunit alpha, partial [Candidatus Competibacterales bacterium]|nr:tryptophan synthase subunit alpha [Candidatus Competibacterales bacterium]
MSRIESRFRSLHEAGRKALIPFVTAGFPRPGLTVPVLHRLVAAGADVIELGVPFSDPMADGPVIQKAGERALAQGMSLARVLDLVAEFRREDADTPLVLMGYLNPIEAMGHESFARRAAEAGVDGVLTVDLPLEEADELVPQLQAAGLDPIFLLAPTSSPERIRRTAEVARGYVYYVSLKGVTGSGALDTDAVAERVAQIRPHIGVPVGVGFGIKDAATAAAIGRSADAVVVGSALVARMAERADDEPRLLDEVSGL